MWDILQKAAELGPALYLQRLTLLSPRYLSTLTRMGPAGGHLSVFAMALEERSRNKWAGEIPSSILCVAPFLADFLYSFAARGQRRVQHDSGSAKDPNGPASAVLNSGESPVHGARIVDMRRMEVQARDPIA